MTNNYYLIVAVNNNVQQNMLMFDVHWNEGIIFIEQQG